MKRERSASLDQQQSQHKRLRQVSESSADSMMESAGFVLPMESDAADNAAAGVANGFMTHTSSPGARVRIEIITDESFPQVSYWLLCICTRGGFGGLCSVIICVECRLLPRVKGLLQCPPFQRLSRQIRHAQCQRAALGGGVVAYDAMFTRPRRPHELHRQRGRRVFRPCRAVRLVLSVRSWGCIG